MSERSEALADLIALASAVQPVLGDRLRQIADILGSNGWITGRDPEEDGTYQVTRLLPYCEPESISAFWTARGQWQVAGEVVAWMPLPEPLKSLEQSRGRAEKGGGE